MTRLVPAAVALVAIAGAAGLRSLRSPEPTPTVLDPATLAVVSVGHPAVGGLVAWIGAVRVFAAADPAPGSRDRAALARAIDGALDLDPRLTPAATLGAIALARWGDEARALAVLDRGLAGAPDDVPLCTLRGLAALAWADDRADAARHLRHAAALAGDPGLETLAAALSPEQP